MLMLSSTSEVEQQKGIIESTAAIIFLGTPHRGSPELSAIGEWARSMLSNLHIQTTSTILDALGLKTTDLERTHDSFNRLWRQYDFRVKTFEESFGLTGIDLGVLGNRVVSHESSLIGDPREQAETLQANHIQMCRFKGVHDPNYRKVAGDIRGIYTAIDNAQAQNEFTVESRIVSMPEQGYSMRRSDIPSYDPLDQKVLDAVLWYLPFDGMNSRVDSITPPSPNTGGWLFQDPTYTTWCNSSETEQRLLLIKGKPGAGKSTLMKKAIQGMQFNRGRHAVCASFFIDGAGLPLQHSQSGILRSLLGQLLPHIKICTAFTDFQPMVYLRKIIREAAVAPSNLSSENTLQTSQTDSRNPVSFRCASLCFCGCYRRVAGRGRKRSN